MLFSSIPFLYYFLPATLLCYYAAPKRLKTPVLLLASLVFYAWGEPRFVLLMAATILAGYALGIAIARYRGSALGRALTALSIAISLGALLYFKYSDFFIRSFSEATGLPLRLLNVSLPVGISFYTFQMLSYTIDVSRGTVPAQRNVLKLATYIAMFPQLIAGPIVRYSEISQQLEQRSCTLADAAYGIRRFIIGLGKKVLLANALGELCAGFLSTSDPSVLYAWLYAIGFTLQIYYDFSGYSDMAIGLGRLLGFTFPENFNFPYISASITEFWRRWHMTLGGWFRDYLYIPLGGNRVSRPRWLLNILIVWIATGLWHGAAWNFAVWGLFYAALLTFEKLWLAKKLEKLGQLSHVYTMLFVVIGFVIFNAQDMAQALEHLSLMFGFGRLPLATRSGLFYLREYAVILIAAAIGATPLPKTAAAALKIGRRGRAALDILEIPWLLGIFAAATACLVNGSFNPFLYFRF